MALEVVCAPGTEAGLAQDVLHYPQNRTFEQNVEIFFNRNFRHQKIGFCRNKLPVEIFRTRLINWCRNLNEINLDITKKMEMEKNCQRNFLKTAVAFTISTGNGHLRTYVIMGG